MAYYIINKNLGVTVDSTAYDSKNEACEGMSFLLYQDDFAASYIEQNKISGLHIETTELPELDISTMGKDIDGLLNNSLFLQQAQIYGNLSSDGLNSIASTCVSCGFAQPEAASKFAIEVLSTLIEYSKEVGDKSLFNIYGIPETALSKNLDIAKQTYNGDYVVINITSNVQIKQFKNIEDAQTYIASIYYSFAKRSEEYKSILAKIQQTNVYGDFKIADIGNNTASSSNSIYHIGDATVLQYSSAVADAIGKYGEDGYDTRKIYYQNLIAELGYEDDVAAVNFITGDIGRRCFIAKQLRNKGLVTSNILHEICYSEAVINTYDHLTNRELSETAVITDNSATSFFVKNMRTGVIIQKDLPFLDAKILVKNIYWDFDPIDKGGQPEFSGALRCLDILQNTHQYGDFKIQSQDFLTTAVLKVLPTGMALRKLFKRLTYDSRTLNFLCMTKKEAKTEQGALSLKKPVAAGYFKKSAVHAYLKEYSTNKGRFLEWAMSKGKNVDRVVISHRQAERFVDFYKQTTQLKNGIQAYYVLNESTKSCLAEGLSLDAAIKFIAGFYYDSPDMPEYQQAIQQLKSTQMYNGLVIATTNDYSPPASPVVQKSIFEDLCKDQKFVDYAKQHNMSINALLLIAIRQGVTSADNLDKLNLNVSHNQQDEFADEEEGDEQEDLTVDDILNIILSSTDEEVDFNDLSKYLEQEDLEIVNDFIVNNPDIDLKKAYAERRSKQPELTTEEQALELLNNHKDKLTADSFTSAAKLQEALGPDFKKFMDCVIYNGRKSAYQEIVSQFLQK